MRQSAAVLLSAYAMCVASRPAFADAADTDAVSPAVAIELYVDSVLVVRAPDIDPPRYETYLRELLRGLVPHVPVIAEAPGDRAASHVLVVDFSPGERNNEVLVTMNVKVGRGIARRMDLGKSVSLTVASNDGARIEEFLRAQVTRIITLYGLRGDRSARVTDDAPATGATTPSIELGIIVAFDRDVRSPAADAVSRMIRTVLGAELPTAVLVGPVEADTAASGERPLLRIDIGRTQASVVCSDPARGTILHAEESYDDGDGAHVLRFLRTSLRSAAVKLRALPRGTSPEIAAPADLPIEREWDDSTGAHAGDTARVPAAPTGTPAAVVRASDRVDHPLPTWRRGVRIAEVAVAGLGVATIGLGAWQGLASRDEAAEYRRARIQLDAVDARQRSEDHARNANALFAAGAAAVVVGGTSIVLDAVGVYDRWSGRGAQASSAAIIPIDRGVIGVWSLPLP